MLQYVKACRLKDARDSLLKDACDSCVGKFLHMTASSTLFKLYPGCPTLVRSDLGSENVIVAACQAALRHRHPDRYAGLNSFQYGRSVHNSVG